MIEFLPAQDNVLAVRLAGTLTPEDVDQTIAEIETKLKTHESIGIFADLTEFKDVTAEALVKDFRYSFGKLGEWKRFPRSAVVTDKKWLEVLYGVLNPLLPGVEIRTFPPEERDQALAWASKIPATAEPV